MKTLDRWQKDGDKRMDNEGLNDEASITCPRYSLIGMNLIEAVVFTADEASYPW